jgi:glucose/mannose-6-phosphate isomerase
VKFDSIPEICHNEVESWPELASDTWRSRFSFVFISDDYEDEKETRIVQGTLNFLRGLGIQNISEINGTGSNRLARLLSAIYMGDYVSFYLAIARGIDPTPINEVSTLKKAIW